MIKKITFHLFFFVLLLAGCQEKGPVADVEMSAGPKMLSSNPADGASELTGSSLTLTLTFDQNIKCSSQQQKLISIDNEAVISKVNAYNTDLTIEITSLKSDEGATYTVTVPEGAVSGFRQNQEASEEIILSFTMKHVEPYVPSELNPTAQLCNPNASQQVKNVYNFLLQQSGKKTLSGVQSSHSYTNDFVDAVYQQTGKHPALAGYDLSLIHI